MTTKARRPVLATRANGTLVLRYPTRVGAIRAAGNAAALWDRVRIIRIPEGFAWLYSHDALPDGARTVATWTGSEWR